MAVELRDPTSGFHHTDVIQFINSEIFSNGGGPEFYLALASQSWNEVEDSLLTILTNQQMPRSLKRACAWSALALGVRVVASQQEQQAHQLHWLQEQLEEREATCRALVFEMHQMREARDQSAAQLRFMRASLQQAFNQCETLRERLLQIERSAWDDSQPQRIVPNPGTEQHEAAVCFVDQTQVMAPRAQGTPYLETQMLVPDASHYVQGSPGPFAQPMLPPLRMPVPHLFPFCGTFSVGFPCSASPACLVERESEAAATAVAADVPQMPPAETYEPVSWDCRYKHPENLQDRCYQGESSRLIQKGEVAPLQGTAPHGINGIQNVIQSSKKQQFQKQKANQTLWEKDSESPKQKSISLLDLIYWVCSQCKAVNLSCYLVCRKCKTFTPPGDETFDL